ncbi:MAG: ABC transporter substrate-binding protein [Paracoccaceae bacterium]
MLTRNKWLTAAVASLVLAAPALRAETPADTLIQAYTLDEIISLDPAEVFEFMPSEVIGNSYETLIGYDPADVSKIFGKVADSWTVSEDGKTISFKIKEGRKFASGNPITADDVVFSLVRAVKLDKSPAFILTQFGFTPDNVESQIVKTGDYSFDFKMDNSYAPSLVLYCLTATVAAVVDKKLALEHETNGDFGYEWLKTGYAGSGPFTIREWRPNEVVVMERNDNYSGDAPKIAREIYRHVPESATQRLMLEQGDVDIARNLNPEDLAALKSNPDIALQSGVKGSLYYMGLNQKNETLAKPEVREAMKYLVDYDAIAETILKGGAKVHQAFLPEGFLGAYNENPYKLDVAKAKELLAKAGLPDGFSVKMSVRNSGEFPAIAEAIQQTMAQGGVKLELVQGDSSQNLTQYRARQHDIFFGQWGPDYQDPHTNADTFARNTDNSDEAKSKPLAWRNAWPIPELSKETAAAMLERDTAKRAEMYVDLQKKVMADGPFIVMFQQTENVALRKNVKGFIVGPSFNDNSFIGVSKE